MDTQQQPQSITSVQNCPAQLWIGPTVKLITHTHEYMKKRWCNSGGCSQCTICSRIEQHQYHSMLWVEPEGNYTRDTLDMIFETIQFALDENSEMIFVINHADYLTAACYNSLLKSIEEPPRGYHFIFLAERLDAVASTIRSRCTITQFAHMQADITQHQLAKFFINHQYENPTTFMQALDSVAPDENQTTELIDALLQYWIIQYKNAIQNHDNTMISTSHNIVALLQKALEEPPMAGSSKLFWKNLLVQLKH
jgi:DNA polymerase-3 subunit delta'